MKVFKCLGIILTITLSLSCSDSVSPTKEPDFSQLQFYADVSEGWGYGFELRVYKSGWALVKNWPPVEGEWEDAIEISLNSSEMKVMNRMESDFYNFRDFYPLARIDSYFFTVILASDPSDTTYFCCPGVEAAEVPEILQSGAGVFIAIAERGLK